MKQPLLHPYLWVLLFVSITQCLPPVFSQEIRVMSYNIHHGNPPARQGVIDLEAIAQVITKEQPDLVALQEVDVRTGRSGPYHQAEVLSKKTGLYAYFAKAIDYDGGAYGLAILSRFPIQQPHTYPLPSHPGTGGEPRVLATVQVELPNGSPLLFACTHLDAQQRPESRHTQIREINRILQEAPHPVILAGDLNDTIGSETIRVLDEHFQRSCEDCAPTIPADRPVKAIDFIAFKPQDHFTVLQHQTIPEKDASDHCPVLSVFRLKQQE